MRIFAIAILAAVTSPAWGQPYRSYDPNAAAELQRQTNAIQELQAQQRRQYYQMKQEQDERDYKDQMRRYYPDWR